MPVNEETLKYRKEHNLCPRDGRPNAKNRKMCESCLVKSAAKTERYRKQQIEGGLCTNCGTEKPVGSSRLCRECKNKASIYCHNAHIKRYGTRKKSGVCVDCRAPAEPGKTMCLNCLQKRSNNQSVQRHNRIADNLCSQCGNDLGNSTGKRCRVCIDNRNDWYQGSTTQIKDKVRRDENRKSVLERYGGKCVCCGEIELYFLAIDHVEGNGNTHRKEINKYGSGFFEWLIKNNFPEGFQVLCHNCNMGKHLNGGVCPHQEQNESEYKSVPPNRTFTVKTRYVYVGKMPSVPYDFDI